MPRRHLAVSTDRFPMAAKFVIARGSRTEAVVVTAAVTEGSNRGRGEGVPYSRYGEGVDLVVSQIRDAASLIESGASREELQLAMPAGAARNALDCAMWDLECKQQGTRAMRLAGIERPEARLSAYTISIGSADEMYEAARRNSSRPLLKVKLDGTSIEERIQAVRAGAPAARLLVDANESWGAAELAANIASCLQAGVELVEQPLPANDDEILEAFSFPIPICADESVRTRSDLALLKRRYAAVNIKLDKCGGLTEALLLIERARAEGFQVMVGCMVSSSLSMAPAVVAAQRADIVDLDGPLLLAADRDPPITYRDSMIEVPGAELWG